MEQAPRTYKERFRAFAELAACPPGCANAQRNAVAGFLQYVEAECETSFTFSRIDLIEGRAGGVWVDGDGSAEGAWGVVDREFHVAGSGERRRHDPPYTGL